MPQINTNVASIRARSNFDRVQRDMDQSIARLSSGKRVNTAQDDAAGVAIIGRMNSQIRGLSMQIRNTKDFQSMANTVEGALQEVSEILQRMRELAVQASSGVATATDRGYLDKEVEALSLEIEAIADNTKFNNTLVLTGANFQMYTDIGATAGAAVSLAGVNFQTDVIVVAAANVSVHTQSDAANAITNIDNAIVSVDSQRAAMGALSNRLDHTVDNLTNVVANTVAAKSRIEDADYAVETTNLTRATILQQAATSMIAQANASKNSILSLIQG